MSFAQLLFDTDSPSKDLRRCTSQLLFDADSKLLFFFYVFYFQPAYSFVSRYDIMIMAYNIFEIGASSFVCDWVVLVEMNHGKVVCMFIIETSYVDISLFSMLICRLAAQLLCNVWCIFDIMFQPLFNVDSPLLSWLLWRRQLISW